MKFYAAVFSDPELGPDQGLRHDQLEAVVDYLTSYVNDEYNENRECITIQEVWAAIGRVCLWAADGGTTAFWYEWSHGEYLSVEVN